MWKRGIKKKKTSQPISTQEFGISLWSIFYLRFDPFSPEFDPICTRKVCWKWDIFSIFQTLWIGLHLDWLTSIQDLNYCCIDNSTISFCFWESQIGKSLKENYRLLFFLSAAANLRLMWFCFLALGFRCFKSHQSFWPIPDCCNCHLSVFAANLPEPPSKNHFEWESDGFTHWTKLKNPANRVNIENS